MVKKFLQTTTNFIVMKTIGILSIFTSIGLLCGFLYYHFFGCTSNCMITSSPINSTLYGGLIGILLGFSLKKENKNDNY